MKTIFTTLITIAIVTAALRAGQTTRTPTAQATVPTSHPSREGSGAHPDFGAQARWRAVQAVLTEGEDARKRGDLATAEAKILQALATYPSDPSITLTLGKLYEAMGRTSEAVRAYASALHGDGRTWSSQQGDPRILAHYGDLCLNKEPAEARWAYARAAGHTRRSHSVLPPGAQDEPDTDPTDDSLPALRAAAHMAAGIEWRNVADDGAYRREVALALSLAPSWWVPHFYRADDWATYRGLFSKENPAKEAALAERLAPNDEARTMVTEMRRSSRIPDEQGRLLPIVVPGQPVRP